MYSTGEQSFSRTNRPSYNACGDYHIMDKENIPQSIYNSPMKDVEVSLYSSGSPFMRSNHRQPFEDQDNNSHDSGFSASVQSAEKVRSCYKAPTLSFDSLGGEEEFLDISDLIGNEENTANLPGEFTKLISNPIFSAEKKSPEFNLSRPVLRRAFSSQETSTRVSRKARSCLFKQSDGSNSRSFKRPEKPLDESPFSSKRSRIDAEEEVAVSIIHPPLYRSFSSATCTSEETIKTALQRSSTEPDLIGDFSKAYCLPLIEGKHQDLKAITPSTLHDLIQGRYDSAINSFKVIDCRYPYEYKGGHISGALNIYTKEQVIDELLNIKLKENAPKELNENKRDILVFHCEFSSERGPNLSRFLRNVDRIHNKDAYPYLHYPEIYLLEGGYKKFYEQFSNMCVPQNYLPMLHPSHKSDLCHFRAKAKTWNSDCKRTSNISYIKRL